MKHLFFLSVMFCFAISCRQTGISAPKGVDIAKFKRPIKGRPDIPSPVDDFHGFVDKVTDPPGCSYCDEKREENDESVINDKSGEGDCDIAGTTARWKKNCSQLLSSNKVPKDALVYALSVLKKNATSFESTKCYKYGDPNHKSKGSLRGKSKRQFEKGYMSKGIRNKCQMIINDLGQRKRGNQCMTKTFMIDLCKNKVTPIYSFIGYGTCKKKYKTYGKYTNRSGLGTTTLGAFVSGPKFGYKSEKKRSQLDASYKGVVDYLARKGVKKIPAASLFGLNTTNSRSAVDFKYIHNSPYTSAGCNSIPKERYKETLQTINNGPSLVVNYKKGRMEPIDKCSK